MGTNAQRRLGGGLAALAVTGLASIAAAWSPPAPANAASGRGVTLAEVRVRDYSAAGVVTRWAHPRRGWRPKTDPGQTLRLRIAPGEAMDGAWVRRQFAANGLIGVPTTADRVVSLVLRINEAFVQNGYINTGLRFGARDWPGPAGALDLVLVSGAVTPALPRGRGVAVVWAKTRVAAHPGNPIARAVGLVQDLGGAKGSGGLKASYVRDRMPSASRAPLNTDDLGRDFRRLSDDPAIRTVNAQVSPGARPGEAHVAMTVEPAPRIDVYAQVATSRSPSIGGLRYSGGATARNLLFSGDLLSIDGGETDGLSDGFIDYAAPFLDPSTTLGVRGSMNQAAVLAQAVRALGIQASETDFEARLFHRLIDEPLTPRPDGGGWKPATTLSVGLRFTTRHADSSLLGQPFSFSPGSVSGVTDLNVIRGEADYVVRGEKQVLAVTGTASFGLTGTGSTLPGVIRPDPNFKVILLQTSYARRLGGGLSFKARLDAQQSSGPLYASEQFSAGGADTVRGYRENLLLADSGVRGGLELDCPVAFGHPICNARTDDWKAVRLAVFTDGAYMRDHEGVQPKPLGIASAGFGLTWTPRPGIEADVSYAPLKSHAPQTGPKDIQDLGFQFNITVHPLSLIGAVR